MTRSQAVFRPLALVSVVIISLSGLAGCGSYAWSGNNVSFSARADQVAGLRSEVVSHTIAVTSSPVRVQNLAGHVHLRHGDVDAIHLDATVYARGRNDVETDELMEAMRWVEITDEHGQPALTLDYPVDRYRSFHYSTAGPGFSMTNTRSYGRKITVSTQLGPGVPTLFADVDVVYPRGTSLSFFNVAGPMSGDRLEGALTMKTIVGDVDVASHDGTLMIDTGSGDITLETASGSIRLDTGSGDIRIAALEGDGTLDTGSGDITIDSAHAARVRADTGSGEVLVRNGVIDDLSIDTGSGDIDVHDVDFESFHGDTGSGRITIVSSLVRANQIDVDTGSGDVTIVAGQDASFDLLASLSSGRTRIGYDGLSLVYDGHRLVGARRGDGRTRIRVDTGSGDLVLRGRESFSGSRPTQGSHVPSKKTPDTFSRGRKKTPDPYPNTTPA